MRYAVLILLLVVYACSKSEPAASHEPEAEESAQSPSPSQGSGGSAGAEQSPSLPPGNKVLPLTPASIELVSAGKPPLQTLRTQHEIGTKRTLRVTANVAAEGLLQVLKVESISPKVVYEIDLETREVAPDGKALVEFTVANLTVESRPGVKPKTVDNFKQAAAWIKGFKGSYAVDSRGVAQTDSVVAPPAAPPKGPHVIDQIRRALNETSLPFPDEPVGRGGKWKVSQVVEEGGIHIDQTSTFELIKANKSFLSVRTMIAQTAPKQVYFPPGGPPGREFELIMLESQTIGKGKWNRTGLGPSAAGGKTVTNQQWVGPGPERVAVSTSTETVVKMSSK